MEMRAPSSRGLLGSLQGLSNGLIGTVHDRLELLSIELHEEKFRLIQIFIWISAAIFTGMMAITFASITVVYLFPDESRLKAVAALAGLYTLGVILIIVGFKRYLAKQPKPFEATIHELKDDLHVSADGAE
jgi:uncharacterized membrane protein YqjE